jgi:hypothetical protein
MLTEQAGALRLGSKASSLIDGCLPTRSFGFPMKTSEGKYPCCSSQGEQATPRDEEDRVPEQRAANRGGNWARFRVRRCSVRFYARFPYPAKALPSSRVGPIEREFH